MKHNTRPVAGQKDEPRKPLSGLPGKLDRPKVTVKPRKTVKKVLTIRDAKQVIREHNHHTYVTAIGEDK